MAVSLTESADIDGNIKCIIHVIHCIMLIVCTVYTTRVFNQAKYPTNKFVTIRHIQSKIQKTNSHLMGNRY